MTTTRLFARIFLLGALIGSPLLAHAEDIDLYDGASSADPANILIVLDNGANFESKVPLTCFYDDDGGTPSLGDTAGAIEQCAIYNAISGLPTSAANIGFMAFNSTSFTKHHGCIGSEGGCLLRPMVNMTAENKAALLLWIKNWTTSADGPSNIKGSGGAVGQVMQEAWAYLSGGVGMSGTDYSDKKYAKPLANVCKNSFVVYIANAYSNNNTQADTGSASPSAALAKAPGITSALLEHIKLDIKNPQGVPVLNTTTQTYELNPSCGVLKSTYKHDDSSGNFADEWARYMAQKSNITSYSIGLLGDKCIPDYPALLSSMADVSGGKFFAVADADGMKNALIKILNEIQPTNSQFSSSSLPVSVNTQGTYLNQVYMGMFRPAKDGTPRWPGNLKQYQFVKNKATGVVQLADINGDPAISSGSTGFISPNAISFWTHKDTTKVPDATDPVTGAAGFWRNQPSGTAGGFDREDGEIVEKGGAAQRLRSDHLTVDYTAGAGSANNPRKLYTYCPSGGTCVPQLSASANGFTTTNNDARLTALGTNLINWVRGHDNKLDDEKGPGGTVNVRPSIHGDVLHSRPLVVSYGGPLGAEELVAFYGTNGGVFHAVNASQSNTFGGAKPGGELWGLVLPEFFDKLSRQQANWPVVKFPMTAPALNPLPKDYFVDGPSGMYQQLGENGVSEKVYIYLTMRRGGRFVYALDVTTATDPRVLWKKSSGSAGMGELGQTWSRPRLGLVKGYVDNTGKAKPVLIFGAGYSPSQDSEPPTADAMGRGIFILDAVDGSVVWSAQHSPTGTTVCTGTANQASCDVADMDYSIPGDIAFVDRDRDGFIDRLYAADLGGNVWRVDLETASGYTPDKWQVNKLAALGCATGACASGTTPRKFHFQPSVIPVGVAGGSDSFDAVMVGSGDREHPLFSEAEQSAYKVSNRLYMLKDVDTGKDGSGLVTITEAALFDATNSEFDNTSTDSGYYVNLYLGEQSVNAPLTIAGVTNFGTNQPILESENACNDGLGTARIRTINFFTGKHRITTLQGGGLPPSPVAGVVDINGEKTGFCIGCGLAPEGAGGQGGEGTNTFCKSALDANCFTDLDGAKKMTRTYWYKR